MIFETLEERFVRAQLFVPYSQAAKYAALRAFVTEQDVHYTQEGTLISVVIPKEHAAKFCPYLK